MNNNFSKVTVFMPVYNGEKYLQDAISSILKQTFTNFEFLIIDDGSTDATAQIIDSYNDLRIRVIHNPSNLKLIKTLNKGLALASGKYIARMDCDDVAVPERLEKQVALLEQQPDIGIVGTSCLIINAEGQYQGNYPVPQTDLQIRWTSLLNSPFAHPTVMIRRNVLKQNNLNYAEEHSLVNNEYLRVEDFELWTRLLKYTRGANLCEPLLYYRIHSDSATSKWRETQLKQHDRIALRTIQSELPEINITPEQVSQLRAFWIGGTLPPEIPAADPYFLIEQYLTLLTAFMARHASHVDLLTLKRQEILRIAHRLKPYRLNLKSLKLLNRLLKIEPDFPRLYFYDRFISFRQKIYQRFRR